VTGIAALILMTGLAPAAVADGDPTPPTGSFEFWAIDNATQLAEFRFSFADPESGVDHIVFTCDGGLDYIVPYATTVFLPIHDGTAGCTLTYGDHWVSALVYNGVGLSTFAGGSNVANAPAMAVDVSASPMTGHSVTLTSVIPADYTFPGGTYCRWEFRWGTTTALDDLLFDETYGGMIFDAPAAAGGCAGWTFTLPWVPFPQYDVNVELVAGGQASIATAHARFTAAVDSTDPHITVSNLPVVQVLPTTYRPIAGQSVTYERFLLGGALACCFPLWSARLGDGENPDVWESQVGDAFTFTPMSPGSLFVQWSRTDANGLLMGAYYDPPVRAEDTTPPTATTPLLRIRVTASGSSVPLSVTWGGSDVGWGIGLYEVERSVNGGSWAPMVLPTPMATTFSVTASSGSTVRFRVRATDKAGNVGNWATGPTIRVTRISDTSTSVHYSTGWSKVADSSAFSGYLHETKMLSAKATYSFTGRDIAWIAEKGPGHGKARVYIDGIAVATIDLTATSWKARQIVYTKHWSSVGTHTIKIVNLATSGRRMIDLDGFVTLR
jgi:hypothetical protein